MHARHKLLLVRWQLPQPRFEARSVVKARGVHVLARKERRHVEVLNCMAQKQLHRLQHVRCGCGATGLVNDHAERREGKEKRTRAGDNGSNRQQDACTRTHVARTYAQRVSAVAYTIATQGRETHWVHTAIIHNRNSNRPYDLNLPSQAQPRLASTKSRIAAGSSNR